MRRTHHGGYETLNLDVVLINRSSFIGYPLPERVELHDAGDEYCQSHECAAHGVDDDALGDEIHILVADHLDGVYCLPVNDAREVVFRARIIWIEILNC